MLYTHPKLPCCRICDMLPWGFTAFHRYAYPYVRANTELCGAKVKIHSVFA